MSLKTLAIATNGFRGGGVVAPQLFADLVELDLMDDVIVELEQPIDVDVPQDVEVELEEELEVEI